MSTPLATALAKIVGPSWVRHHPSERATFRADGLPTHEAMPKLVVLPGSRAEVLEIVQLLHLAKAPFVARGAGTGLSGGSLAGPDAILITLTRLNKILAIQPERRRAIVEPGVINARLSEAAAAFGLHYAPDPSSQTACTIGGNVAENAGGPHCLKYGVTANHIVAMELVLPDASTVRLGSPQGEPWGPDLVGLVVGSEGMFGIVTEVTVKLEPLPPAIRTFLADFSTIRDASRAVSAIIASGVIPAALEMMDRPCVRAVEASIYAAGLPTDAAAVLLVELDGSRETVEAEAAIVEDLLRSNHARSVGSARDADQRQRLWQGRKKAFGALGRLAPDLVVQDAVVPRSSLPDVLEAIEGIGRRYELTIANVFHAGDGNLHPNISFDRRNVAMAGKVAAASHEIMAVCVAAGGTITGEHGVGLDKRQYMPLVFDPTSLDAMCAVRRVFDPEERANRGKLFPTHACREWRAGGIP